MSFTAVTDNLKNALEGNAALEAFCVAAFGKGVTALKFFKNRQELDAEQFPLIMITRPSVKKRYLTGAKDGTHTILLLCGFYCDDRTLAQDYIVQFEELIDDAILADATLGGTAIDALPDESENDGGFYHPYYFIGMTVEVRHRR